MTVTFKKISFYIAFVVITNLFAATNIFADSKDYQGESKDGFSFSSVVKDVTEAAKNFTGVGSGKDKKTAEKRVQTADITSETVDSEVLEKTTCEYFSSTVTNVLGLSSDSAESKLKIEKVEETLLDESYLRDNLLGSFKDLISLQKKEKIIFREMQRDILEAKNYYDNVDRKVEETEKFLDENICETVKMEMAKDVDEEISNAVLDEAVYRKQFAASLKEKMRILQENVKSAKK